MSALIVFAALALVLFAISYITKRRFGVLGLGLAAGAVISTYATAFVTPLLAESGLAPSDIALFSLVEVVLVLLPAFALLFSGPKYDSKLLRLLGSILFVVLALALVVTPLSAALVMDEASIAAYEAFTEFQAVIIVGGVGLSVFDVFVTRSHSKSKPKKTAEH